MRANPRRLVAAAAIITLMVALIVIVTRSDRSRDLVLQIQPHEMNEDVVVYVGGEVRDPGLVSLPRGSRVEDALDLAGPLDTAQTSGLNPALVLEDEQSIIVPAQSPSTVIDSETDDESSVAANHDLINLNSADIPELQQLPGIGPALAERIIDHRTSEGPFSHLDDLAEISGISERMIEEFAGLAYVGR